MSSLAERTHALLIGINHYSGNRFYKPLKGCVRDISLVGDYLQTAFQIPPENIYRLLSPNQTQTSQSQPDTAAEITKATEIAEQHEQQATYENIVQAFADITKRAQPNDQVYIHYCGHGGRAKTTYPELKGTGQTDEGLVPTDIGTVKRYVRDVEMAMLLKRLVDKELIVTMVLDCCHSGGATRGDCAVRGSGETDTQAATNESLVASREELVANWRSLTENPSQTHSRQPQWFPNSPQCVVLAACRPTEQAFEYVVPGDNERHGALTYWMIDTLSSFGHQLSYQTLHNRISAKIQSKFPAQLPMLLGTGTRMVLGTESSERSQQSAHTTTVLTIDTENSVLTLSAGAAQGITKGSQFAIYPLGAPLNVQGLANIQQQATVKITHVEATQSTARILPAAENASHTDTLQNDKRQANLPQAIEQGSPAVKLSEPLSLLRRIQLYDQKPVGNEDNQLPAAVAGQQVAALEAVREAIAHSGWLTEITHPDQASDYQVSVSPKGNYEIFAGVPITNLTPALSIDEPNAAQQVANRLVHLAKYQTVQALDNPTAAIAQFLTYELLDRNRNPLPLTTPIRLKNGEKIFLRIHNSGPIPLNIAILDLQPTWAISQIPIQGIPSPFYPLSKGETSDTPLRFRLPKSAQYQQAKETLKIFATKGPANYQLLHLPPLDQQIPTSRAAAQSPADPFSQMLAAVSSDRASEPVLTRSAASTTDWTTYQFQIVVD